MSNEFPDAVSDWDESPDSPEVSSVPAAPVATPAETARPPVETGPSDRPADSDEDKPDEGMTRDDRGRWRRRAKSQQAGADDVPRIKELTKRLRTVEQELQSERAGRQSQTRTAPLVPTVPQAPQVQFSEREPQLEQFADKDDPYGAWQRALAAYDRKRERAEEQAQHMQAHQQRTTQDVGRYWEGVRTNHQQRLVAAVQANPSHYQALQSVQVAPPPLLDWAIMLDSQSADVALFLATHPTILDEFALMTAVQPVTEATVATTQRLLRQRMTAVGSGAVAPSPSMAPAPRPPTPLRTAPMKTGETAPGDDDSVEAHERFYPRLNHRRR